MDFGGLTEFKAWTEHMFDHTLCVAEDDPEFQTLMLLDGNIADIRVIPAVGCERFAEMCYNKMSEILNQQIAEGTALNKTVRVKSAEVFEHGANSAIYEG
jgi:6-pyruvoyltetrahydropterin/6-carboxytetrahydropterin synthase